MQSSGQLHALATGPGKKFLNTNRTGDWVGSTASIETLEKIKMSCVFQEVNHDSMVVQPAA